MKKRNIIWAVLSILVIAVLAIIYVHNSKKYKNELTINCSSVEGASEIIHSNSNNILACYGNIVVYSIFQEKYYTVIDSKNNISLAEIENLKDIKQSNNSIYFKAVNLYHFTSNDIVSYTYFDGINNKTINAALVEQLPKYFVVDILTGAVRLYSSLDEVPEAERLNF